MFHRDRLPAPLDYFEAEGFTLTGRGKWRSTACPFHGSGSSLRVNVESGAFICMAGCGARGGDLVSFHQAHHGVGFVRAAKDLGAWRRHPRDPAKPRRRPTPFSPRDALEVFGDELLLVVVAALNVHQGVALTDADRARLLVAARRVHTIWSWMSPT